MLFLDVLVEVPDKVIHLLTEDSLKLGINLWMEVIQPVNEGPEIAL